MAERFTGPSRECMEWLGEMGPSADDVHGSFTGCTARALESEHFQELACTAVCEVLNKAQERGCTMQAKSVRRRRHVRGRGGPARPRRATLD